MTQIWLFASCIFLFLTEEDAVLCRQCTTIRPWIPCFPPEGRCAAAANEHLCMTLKVYKDFERWQVVMSCTDIDDPKCDDWHMDNKTEKMYIYSCCSNKDFCNNN